MSHTPAPWTAIKLSYRSSDCTIGFENPDDEPLALAAPEMLEMLREVEWWGETVERDGMEWYTCPICSNTESEGHAGPDGDFQGCRLAALIAKASGVSPSDSA